MDQSVVAGEKNYYFFLMASPQLNPKKITATSLVRSKKKKKKEMNSNYELQLLLSTMPTLLELITPQKHNKCNVASTNTFIFKS